MKVMGVIVQSASSESTAVATFEDASDPAKQALKRWGLKIGDKYTHKDQGDKIFVLQTVSEDEGIFVSTPLFKGLGDADIEVRCEYKRLKDWKPFKGTEPSLFSSTQLAYFLVDNAGLTILEYVKCITFQTLVDHYIQVGVDDVLFSNDAVWTKKQFKKHGLQISPIGSLKRIQPTEIGSSNKHAVVKYWHREDEPYVFIVQSPQSHKVAQVCEQSDVLALSPFHWIKITSSTDANMESLFLTVESKDVSIQIPIFASKRVVQKHEMLQCCNAQPTSSAKRAKK